MKHNKLKAITILSTLSLGIISFTNKFITSAAGTKNILKTNHGQFYNWRFGNIYYTKTGKGFPLLLIHDLKADSSSFEWKCMVKKLSKDHTVYALDLLGCGNSDKPKITYTNYLYVQLLNDFVKNIIKEKTDVIATGFSTSFVIMACSIDNNIFDKIMIINPEKITTLMRNPNKKSKIIKFLIEMPIIGTMLYHMLFSKSNIDYNFNENYFFNPFFTNQKYIDAYYESSHLKGSAGKYLFSSLEGNYVNVNMIDALKKINNSIVIIAGKKEPSIISILDQYTQINPAIEKVLLSSVKKLPQLEASDKLYEQIKIYFNE